MIYTGDPRKLVIVDRPKAIYVWGGRALILFIVIAFFYRVLNGEEGVIVLEEKLLPFGVIGLIAGLLVGFYKKEIVFDVMKNEIVFSYFLMARVSSKSRKLSDFNRIEIRSEEARVEVGDIGEKATYSRGVDLFYVELIPKTGMKKPKLPVKKCFSRKEAEEILFHVNNRKLVKG